MGELCKLLTTAIFIHASKQLPVVPGGVSGGTVVSDPFDNYMDLVEAARILGIHPQSLRRLIKQRKVPAVIFAGKYLIERDKLEMFKANYDPRPGRKPLRRLL